jgi:hypothetical protein
MSVTVRAVISLLLTGAAPIAARSSPPQAALTLDELEKALGETVTVTASVSAIDYDARVVVLRDAQKNERSLYVGEDVKKLQSVKVGDTVKVSYQMSLATRILKPGEPAPKTGTTDSVVGTAPGARPAGTLTVQERWVVVVDAVDLKQQTVTVRGEKGRTFTVRAVDAARLAQLEVGDRAEITVTAAALVSVEPAK